MLASSLKMNGPSPKIPKTPGVPVVFYPDQTFPGQPKHKQLQTPTMGETINKIRFFQRRNRNEELSSMLPFEISHLSSTTSVEEVICRLRHQFLRHLISSWAYNSVIKRNFAAKLYINERS